MRIDDRKMLMDLLLKAPLSDKEFIILARRYGLDEREPIKPQQIAQMLNMLEWEVRKICRLTLLKLRSYVDDVDKERFDRLIFDLVPPRKA